MNSRPQNMISNSSPINKLHVFPMQLCSCNCQEKMHCNAKFRCFVSPCNPIQISTKTIFSENFISIKIHIQQIRQQYIWGSICRKYLWKCRQIHRFDLQLQIEMHLSFCCLINEIKLRTNLKCIHVNTSVKLESILYFFSKFVF